MVKTITPAHGRFLIGTSAGELDADIVVCALPASDAATALYQSDSELAGALREIPAVSTATVTMGFDRRELGELPSGFGFVVPKGAGRTITAGTFVSQKFPSRNTDLFMIRCFLGGAGKEEQLGASDERLVEQSLVDLREMACVRAKPKLYRVYRWEKANPQYTIGHESRMRGIELRLQRHPGLLLAGASYYGVGVPDCIRSGNEVAQRVLRLIRN
jgi:oxygen-dependent protoporphyrinogen oxidase